MNVNKANATTTQGSQSTQQPTHGFPRPSIAVNDPNQGGQVVTSKLPPGWGGSNAGPSNQQANQPTGEKITKSGYPDRRFKGQRDLPPPPEFPVERRFNGMIDEEGHVRTKDGKPDRRFKGNRSLSDEQAAIEQAKWVLSHAKGGDGK